MKQDSKEKSIFLPIEKPELTVDQQWERLIYVFMGFACILLLNVSIIIAISKKPFDDTENIINFHTRIETKTIGKVKLQSFFHEGSILSRKLSLFHYKVFRELTQTSIPKSFKIAKKLDLPYALF